MKKYLVLGVSGSGKSLLTENLVTRGHHAIDTDHHTRLSAWVNITTGKLAAYTRPPVSKDWLEVHRWRWNEARLHEILAGKTYPDIFLCGGAHNVRRFFYLFDRISALYIDNATMKRRLQAREPERRADGSAELKRMLAWKKYFRDKYSQHDIAYVDRTLSPDQVTNRILSFCHDD